jgi:hypothetical protein
MSNRVPIGMLITSVRNVGNDERELFGFWYHKEIGLPISEEERKNFLSDLMIERCCQVSIKGSRNQVEEIVSFAYSSFNQGEGNEEKVQKEIVSIFNFLRTTPDAAHLFDDLMEPKGTSLPANIIVMVDEDYNSLKRKILAKPDTIKLELDKDWSLMKDLFDIE